MQSISYFPKVCLQSYDGPLDLLLSLIKKNKINIYDIPIAQITDQYLEAAGLNEQGGVPPSGAFNLDAGGDFIVMAAQLIYIKSVMLLPGCNAGNTGAEGGEDCAGDPRAELADMLLEYQKVKEVAGFLNNRPILGRDVFAIKIFKDDDNLIRKQSGNTNDAFGNAVFDANIFILSRCFYDKMTEAQNRISSYEIEKETFSVKEKIVEIMEMFNSFQYIPFSRIAVNSSSKDELFTYFLALLEMARLVLISIDQLQAFGDIFIYPTRNGLSTYPEKIASMN